MCGIKDFKSVQRKKSALSSKYDLYPHCNPNQLGWLYQNQLPIWLPFKFVQWLCYMWLEFTTFFTRIFPCFCCLSLLWQSVSINVKDIANPILHIFVPLNARSHKNVWSICHFIDCLCASFPKWQNRMQDHYS